MKYIESTLDGLPVVQINSMQPLDDFGNQLANRLFKASVNESIEQDPAIESWQKREMLEGRKDASGAVIMTRHVVYHILEKEGFDVRNPFVGCIKLKLWRETGRSRENRREAARSPSFKCIAGADFFSDDPGNASSDDER